MESSEVTMQLGRYHWGRHQSVRFGRNDREEAPRATWHIGNLVQRDHTANVLHLSSYEISRVKSRAPMRPRVRVCEEAVYTVYEAPLFGSLITE